VWADAAPDQAEDAVDVLVPEVSLVTDDTGLARVCPSLRNQGRAEQSGWYRHERLGYNYGASELTCALGLAQLRRIDEILATRARVASWYEEKLSDMDDWVVPSVAPEVDLSWFVYVMRLGESCGRMEGDEILAGLRQHGVRFRAYFPPAHLQSFYRKQFGYQEGMFPVAESVAAGTFALPFYGNLTQDQVDYVVACLREVVAQMGENELGPIRLRCSGRHGELLCPGVTWCGQRRASRWS